jgi:hypothetical protein
VSYDWLLIWALWSLPSNTARISVTFTSSSVICTTCENPGERDQYILRNTVTVSTPLYCGCMSWRPSGLPLNVCGRHFLKPCSHFREP